ncbi:response regulator transcription factor [Hymenobacter aerilatus]|uniref:Response regulator transcription factor n=1 Tax=Hymenobacter aerilatus TaxID=2932251 RepID=A0A8T9T4K0_9BACT|nr:response regulator transcription factor [Hymenobacter aerilatus]UOR07570.1 response regulator transcription factor [Hymenobacter aerilatus]
MIRTILVDDHAIIRDGISFLLQQEPDIEIVDQAGHGQELLDKLATMPADVVLMDINMPIMGGEEAIRHVRALYPQTQVLILSMLDHEAYISRMMEAGASGYILKNAGKEEIIFGIRSVAAGRQFLCSELAFQLLYKLQGTGVAPAVLPSEPAKKESILSRRELEVLKLISEGLTTSEIADKLYNSKRTIETHRQNMMEKTQAKNTASLIKYALSNGLIE